MNKGGAIYRRSSITADSLFFLGFGLKILPVQCLLWLRGWYRMIGKGYMDIVRYFWRPWLIKEDSGEPVIRRLIGLMWERRLVEEGWTVGVKGKGSARKRYTSTPLHPDFGKLYSVCRGAYDEPVLCCTNP
jgi:hypothetical protein